MALTVIDAELKGFRTFDFPACVAGLKALFRWQAVGVGKALEAFPIDQVRRVTMASPAVLNEGLAQTNAIFMNHALEL